MNQKFVKVVAIVLAGIMLLGTGSVLLQLFM